MCTEDDCARDAYCKGMCKMHYNRASRLRNGTPRLCDWCGGTYQQYEARTKFCGSRCSAASRVSAGKTTAGDLTRAYLAGDASGIIAAIRARCVVTADGCWSWTGGKAPGGYASASVCGKTKRLNRLVLEVKLGHALGTYEAHHTCAVRACVNPDHLQMVHKVENIAEMKARNSLEGRVSELEQALLAIDPNHPLVAHLAKYEVLA